jgi:hypothetical protein
MWLDFPDLKAHSPAQGAFYSILPLQTGCPHLQSMSGIFSIDSHCTLQYFPAIAVHEQFGCAHFFVFSIAISLSLDQSVLASLAVGVSSPKRVFRKLERRKHKRIPNSCLFDIAQCGSCAGG